MKRKVVESDGRGGLVERYVEVGGPHPGRPVRGHGRPVASIATPGPGAGNVVATSGIRQVSLGGAS